MAATFAISVRLKTDFFFLFNELFDNSSGHELGDTMIKLLKYRIYILILVEGYIYS